MILEIKTIAPHLWCGFCASLLIGAIFLISAMPREFAQSLVQMITIEANPFKFSGIEGYFFILVADIKLTKEFTVNYMVILNSSQNPRIATISPGAPNSLMSYTESRINITELHTQISLLADARYSFERFSYC